MGAISEFFEEVNSLFGFFFDTQLAFHTTRERLEKLQMDIGGTDNSPFMVRSGPPEGPPEQELERSLHATTLGALKQRLGETGLDLTLAAHSVVVFVFHVWDERYRGLVASEKGLNKASVQVDILGDLRLIRNSLIHNKGIAAADIANCESLVRFKPGDVIQLNKKDIEFIILKLREQLQ